MDEDRDEEVEEDEEEQDDDRRDRVVLYELGDIEKVLLHELFGSNCLFVLDVVIDVSILLFM